MRTHTSCRTVGRPPHEPRFHDADRLVNIYNTRRIRAVVAEGRFYDRTNLDSLLVGVERLATQSRRP